MGIHIDHFVLDNANPLYDCILTICNTFLHTIYVNRKEKLELIYKVIKYCY